MFEGLSFLLMAFDEEEVFAMMDDLNCRGGKVIVSEEPDTSTDYVVVPMLCQDLDLKRVERSRLVTPAFINGKLKFPRIITCNIQIVVGL